FFICVITQMKKPFQFKQFLIHAMPGVLPVGTDGILLGGWTHIKSARRILDVGTGTGLLCLMIAQRAPEAYIEGIDISPSAIQAAQHNISLSRFHSRIDVQEADIRTYTAQPFDLIITNPPFFDTGPRHQNTQLATARHTDSLTLSALLSAISPLLAAEGTISMILPSQKLSLALEEAEIRGLFPARITYVSATPFKPPHRVLLQFTQSVEVLQEEELIIQVGGPNEYSASYVRLTKDFYVFM
ncbi:MAG: methyltransferase, partial [Bacteroidota bacterium]